jgi:hypothetical protein
VNTENLSTTEASLHESGIFLAALRVEARRPENTAWRKMLKKAGEPACGCPPRIVNVPLPREPDRTSDCCLCETCPHNHHRNDTTWIQMPIKEAIPIVAWQAEQEIEEQARRFIKSGRPISSTIVRKIVDDLLMFDEALHSALMLRDIPFEQRMHIFNRVVARVVDVTSCQAREESLSGTPRTEQVN